MENFIGSSLEDKILKIVNRNKGLLVMGKAIEHNVYLVDKHDTIHVIPVPKEKFLTNEEYKHLFRGLLKSTIKSLEKAGTRIAELFYLEDTYFNPKAIGLEDLNLDYGFNRYNGNECLLVYREDKLNMEITVFGKISGSDNVGRYTVLSENPLTQLDYSKIDPDDNLGGALTNILR